MKMIFALLAVPLAILAAPEASAQSGIAEATFPATTASEVSGRVATACMDRGHLVVEASPTSVTCEIHMKPRASIVAGLVVGGRYSTRPRNLSRFVIVQAGPDVRVQARQWLEAANGFGRTDTQSVDNPENLSRLRQALYDIGGR